MKKDFLFQRQHDDVKEMLEKQVIVQVQQSIFTKFEVSGLMQWNTVSSVWYIFSTIKQKLQGVKNIKQRRTSIKSTLIRPGIQTSFMVTIVIFFVLTW